MTQEKKHFLDEVEDWGILRLAKYKGCVVQKQADGLYSIWQYKDLTAEQVDEKINNSLLYVDKSIKQ